MNNPKWCVKSVIPTKDFELILTFEYGEKKIFDMKPYLDKPNNEPLRDINFFLKAHVEYDSVAWSEDEDIAPEFLYEKGIPIED